jgi:ArsR family transcriptional regulator, arsenate/arsenite/antimonite-responsive transcriptional repressor
MKEIALVGCCQPLADGDLTDDDAGELERLFQALADRTRVRIVNLLARASEPVCVCALVPALGLSQPTVSYHLKQLAQAGIALRERRGTFAYYELAPGALERIGSLFLVERTPDRPPVAA